LLIAKGYSVSFRVNNRWIKAPGGYALLHDPSGSSFAKCAALIAPFSKNRQAIQNGEARSYFGQDPLGGSIAVPPRALSAWKKVGPVEEIRYTRKCPGRKCAHAAPYFHPFEKGYTPMLYRRGRLLRLELGPGCEWTERGIVRP
jgi:hypothetical protein